MNRIELREVSKRYGKKSVLDGLNITVRQGEIYGLIGKNGAGKTTLFKTILGLTEIQGGRVSIDGETTPAGLRKARRKIGFFIGGNFFEYLSAEENLRFYCGVKGIRDTAEIGRVLALVGLSGVKSKFGAFSLGMRQRLGIANAMLGKPEILLLDEPVNGLDPEGIAEMRAVSEAGCGRGMHRSAFFPHLRGTRAYGGPLRHSGERHPGARDSADRATVRGSRLRDLAGLGSRAGQAGVAGGGHSNLRAGRKRAES